MINFLSCFGLFSVATVDGRNSAPVDMVNIPYIPLFTWFYTSNRWWFGISEPPTVGTFLHEGLTVRYPTKRYPLQ